MELETETRILHSFAITVRPKNGLHNEYDAHIIKWLEKQQYFAYVHEMEHEARHLHAIIWGKYCINNIRKTLFRFASKYDADWGPASKKVLSSGVKFVYNDMFHTEYMIKDGPYDNSCLPPDTLPYYPTEEEQEEIKKKSTRVADAYFHHLKEEWDLHNPDYVPHQHTNVDIAYFYYDLMFKQKKIAVLCDDRVRKQKCKALLHYIFPCHESKKDMFLSKNDIEIFNINNKTT